MSKFEEKLKKILKETLMDLGVGTPSWPRWMPSKMASRYSGLSDKTLRRLAREGEIYAVNIGGKKFLYIHIPLAFGGRNNRGRNAFGNFKRNTGS